MHEVIELFIFKPWHAVHGLAYGAMAEKYAQRDFKLFASGCAGLGEKMTNRIMTLFSGLAKFLEKLSIEKKLILSNILLLAVPVVVLGVILIQNVKASEEADSLRSAQEEVRRAVINIGKNVEVCSRAAQMIMNNRYFLSFASTEQDYDAGDLIGFKSGALFNIQSISSVNPDIYSIRIFLNNPLILEMWGIIYNEEWIINEKWREEVMKANGSYYWRFSHPYKSTDSAITAARSDDVVSLSLEINYPEKRHLGILEINMLSDVFFNDMYNTGSSHEDSFYCIITKDEEFVYNPESAFMAKFNLNGKELQGQLKNNTKEKEGNFTFRHDGKDMTVVYSRMDALNVCLYRISSANMLVNKLDKVRNYILLGIITGIIVLSFMVYFIISILMKKLKKIIGFMRKVQDGDLDVDIPVYGNDEMGELSYHFRKMMVRVKKLITVIVQKQIAVKEAELKALQSQINKHFIYNVLEAVNMLAESHHEYEISEIITSLGKLMRYNMNWDKQYVMLEEEIENTKNYVNLMNARYGNLFVLELDIDAPLLKHEVLRMLIQPVVENAVVHGFEKKGLGGLIRISAYCMDHAVFVKITDNGTGMDTETLDKLRRGIEPGSTGEHYQGGRTGIGLKNVNTRIKLFYGKDYGLEIESEENSYSSVTMKLPYTLNPAWDEVIV